MELKYYFLDPTKNMTILVETPVPAESQPFAAARIMETEPTCEQVGFLTDGENGCDISLRMAGGEFCGNAAMCTAAVWAEKTGTARGCAAVAVSGADLPVAVEITALPDGGYAGTVEMPKPLSAAVKELRLDDAVYMLPVVEFPGISHVIAEQPLPRAEAERAVKAWCRQLGAESLGLMLLDRAQSRLTPLVYVPAAGTLFWESSCASGTAAVGAYLAAVSGTSVSATLQEPGGTLTAEAENGGVLRLSGRVKIVRKGCVSLPLL